MALSQLLFKALTPATIQEHAEARQSREAEAEANRMKRTIDAVNLQATQEGLANKRRAMAVSMLGAIANEQDPVKQQSLYAKIRPMAAQVLD